MRKTFTTTIEEQIQTAFKEACSKNGVRMNDVLEAFMKSYAAGEFEIELEYKLKRTEK